MVNGSSKGENVKNVPKGTLAIVLNHLFLFMTQPMLGLEGGGGKEPKMLFEPSGDGLLGLCHQHLRELNAHWEGRAFQAV